MYLKLVNASSVEQPVEIEMAGAGSVAKNGTVVSLTGTDPAQTNTLPNPTRIVPVKTALTSAGAKFSHTVPAYSIQVLELQAK